MVVLELKKYIYSTMDGSRILHMFVFESGEVIITSENGSSRSFYTEFDEGYSVSADYILCTMQYDPSIEIHKRPSSRQDNIDLGQSTII